MDKINIDTISLEGFSENYKMLDDGQVALINHYKIVETNNDLVLILVSNGGFFAEILPVKNDNLYDLDNGYNISKEDYPKLWKKIVECRLEHNVHFSYGEKTFIAKDQFGANAVDIFLANSVKSRRVPLIVQEKKGFIEKYQEASGNVYQLGVNELSNFYPLGVDELSNYITSSNNYQEKGYNYYHFILDIDNHISNLLVYQVGFKLDKEGIPDDPVYDFVLADGALCHRENKKLIEALKKIPGLESIKNIDKQHLLHGDSLIQKFEERVCVMFATNEYAEISKYKLIKEVIKNEKSIRKNTCNSVFQDCQINSKEGILKNRRPFNQHVRSSTFSPTKCTKYQPQQQGVNQVKSKVLAAFIGVKAYEVKPGEVSRNIQQQVQRQVPAKTNQGTSKLPPLRGH